MTFKKTALARRLRKTATDPERLLWQRLRRQVDGPGFRRQHPLGPYILDFYCAKVRLVVEVDGSTHDEDEQLAKDLRRDAWLRQQGLDVYRVPAAEVYRNADAVADGILLLVAERLQGLTK